MTRAIGFKDRKQTRSNDNEHGHCDLFQGRRFFIYDSAFKTIRNARSRFTHRGWWHNNDEQGAGNDRFTGAGSMITERYGTMIKF